MNKVLYLIFIYSSVTFAGDCPRTSDGLPDSSLVEGLTPKNCISKRGRALKRKKGVCECAKDNLEKIQYKPDPIDQKTYALKVIDKAKLGLFSISEDIVLLSQRFDNKRLTDLGVTLDTNTCNVKNLLSRDSRKNPVFECKNGTKPTLSKDMRQNIAEELKNSVLNEIDNKRYQDKKFKKPAFIKRNERMNSCDNEALTDEFIMSINKKYIYSQTRYLAQILNTAKTTQGKANTILQQVLLANDKFKTKKDGKAVNQFLSMLASNPIMNHLLNSPMIFNEFKNNNFDPAYMEKYLNEGSLAKNQAFLSDLQKTLNQKCESIFTQLNQALCVSEEDNLLPSDLNSTKSVLAENQKENSVADIMQTSAVLDKLYCSNSSKQSKADEIKNKITQNLRPRLKENSSIEALINGEHKASTLNLADKICEFVTPPPMKKLDDQIEKVCSQNKEDPLNQECLLFKSVKLALDETVNYLESKAEKTAAKQAEEKGITDKAEIAKMAQELKDKITTEQVVQQYLAFENHDNVGGVPPLLADFLGVEPKEEAMTVAESSESKNSEKATTSIVEASNSKEADTAKAEAGLSALASNSSGKIDPVKFKQQQIAKRILKKNQENIGDFYQEVSDRITRFRKRQSQNPSGYNSQSASIASNNFSQYIKSPFPDDLSDDEGVDGYIGEEYSEQRNAYPGPNYEGYQTGSRDNQIQKTPQDEKFLASYNKALAGSEGARKVMAKYDPDHGKKESPISISGVGAAKASRSPASRIGGGSSGGVGRGSAKGSRGSSGGSVGLIGRVPEVTIPGSGDIDGAFDQLLNNIAQEKRTGLNTSESIEEAQKLKNLLEKKSFILVSKDNKNHKVMIKRKAIQLNGQSEVVYNVIPYGNESDPEYQKFINKIQNSINIENKFEKVLEQVNSVLATGEYDVERDGPSYNALNRL